MSKFLKRYLFFILFFLMSFIFSIYFVKFIYDIKRVSYESIEKKFEKVLDSIDKEVLNEFVEM